MDSSDPPLDQRLDHDLRSLIGALTCDDKPQMISLLVEARKGGGVERAAALKLLHFCCSHDAVDCVAALVTAGVVAVNEVEEATGMAPLHAAAAANAKECVEMLLKRRARTELKTRDGRGLLALELSLLSARLDVIWSPAENSVEDLVVQLGDKDLTALRLLCEKTKELADVACSRAVEGRIAELAALLIVSADKVNESVLELHDAEMGHREKATVYECVIREALALGRSSAATPPLRAAKRSCVLTKGESEEKRKLLLSEIELLQLFGAVSQSSCTEKKVTSLLIAASQVGDDAVIELLLNTDIDVNGVDADGNSALHWCLKTSKGSCSQQLKVLCLLLKHGAQVNQKNRLGVTAAHIAAANGNAQALQVLLLEDPDCVNTKAETKETPLFFAVKNDCKECAELLLRWGASTDVFNLRKQRPIDLAESQDMRFMLSSTNISLTNLALPIQQKYTAWLQGDKVISETCEELLTSTDEGNITDRTCSSRKTEICKYFESPTGCIRGSKCFYMHDEEELRKRKHGRDVTHLLGARDLDRKIFVGGLPPSLDSDSLQKFFQEQFGSVDDAIVIGVQTGDKIQSRGFGFVTFKDKKSVSVAVEAHYVTIMGKQVEIKSAIPKCLLLTEQERSDQHLQQEQAPRQITALEMPSRQTPNERTTKEMLNWQTPSEKNNKDTPCWQTSDKKNEKGSPSSNTPEEVKSKVMSWVDTLVHGRPKSCPDEPRDKKLPAWLRTFKNWLPCFLQKVSERDGEYALSSLKADFRAAFGLELDHASLGFSKLSDFVRSVPDLCRVKYVPIGRQKPANHMILLPSPPKPHRSLLQPLTMCSPPHTGSIDSVDGDSDDSQCFEDLLIASDENNDFTGSCTRKSTEIFYENSENSPPSANSRFIQFLNPDAFFPTENQPYSKCGGRRDTKQDRGLLEGFKGVKPKPLGRHLVLEALARKKENSSMFFLREFDFYTNYKASITQGKCFGCNQHPAFWVNFPCQHLLWCTDCKQQALKAAADLEHKCVVCDAEVQRIDSMSWPRYCQPKHDTAHFEYPAFDRDYIQNLSKKTHLLTGN